MSLPFHYDVIHMYDDVQTYSHVTAELGTAIR
jgi:hypothetical protein